MMIRFALTVSLLIVSARFGWSVEPSVGAEGLLFGESFEDTDLASRGWYDGTKFRIVGDAAAGKGCIEYEWPDRQSGVKGSSPVRHLFEPTDEVSIRFYLKLSKGWGWSGQNFHPHLTHFLTTENPKWHGPAASHLTLHIEPVGGKLRLAAQDIQNKDMPHGLTQGPLKGGYNGKLYDSQEVLFKDDQWHCVEAYFKLNFGFYVGVTATVLWLYRRYCYSVLQTFVAGGLWGVLIEQQFAGPKMLLSGSVVPVLGFALYVFPVYGLYLAAPRLFFFEEFDQSNRTSRWQGVWLFVGIAVLPLVAWAAWSMLCQAAGFDRTGVP